MQTVTRNVPLVNTGEGSHLVSAPYLRDIVALIHAARFSMLQVPVLQSVFRSTHTNVKSMYRAGGSGWLNQAFDDLEYQECLTCRQVNI